MYIPTNINQRANVNNILSSVNISVKKVVRRHYVFLVVMRRHFCRRKEIGL